MDCLCHVASVIVSVCFGVGSGVGQTYLVMKDLKKPSQNGGGGEWSAKMLIIAQVLTCQSQKSLSCVARKT